MRGRGAEGVGGRGQKAKEDEIRWVLEDVARRPLSY